MNRTPRPWQPTLIAVLAMAGLVVVGGCGTSGDQTGTPTPSPAETPVEIGKHVQLVPGTGCDPERCELRRSSGRDHVRWHNPGTTERTITFTAGWPFMETQAGIVIPAGGWSAWFTLGNDDGDFPYSVNPPLPGPDDPPDGPVISAGD